MQVGLIGLGKMGLNLGKNLIDHKHEVAAFDLNASAVEEMKEYGATGASSLNELVQSLQSPKSSLGYGTTRCCRFCYR